MSDIEKTDWYFLVPATTIWILSLLVTAWGFVQFQGMVYHFGIVNAVGLGLFLAGFALRWMGKRTLGKSYSYVLETSQKGKTLVMHGIYKIIRHPIYLGALLYTLGTPLFFQASTVFW